MKIFITLIFVMTYSYIPKEKYLAILATNYKSPLYIVIPEKGQSNSFFITTTYELHNYYQRINKDNSITYKKFLIEIFDKRIKIDSALCDPHSCFPVNNNLAINKELDEYGIKYIISKYLIPLKGELRSKNLDSQTTMALIKIMFNNSYLIAFSDYSGSYGFKKVN